MESGSHADENQLNIQNDYFNNARKNRTRVTVVLTTGQRISGQIRSFDRFTLILDTRHGDQMVFKHAIATVSPSHAGEREHRGRPHRPGGDQRHRPGGRPPHGGPPGAREGAGPAGGDRQKQEIRQRVSRGPQGKSFGNFMDLSAVSGAREKPPEGKPPAEQEAAKESPAPAKPPKEEKAEAKPAREEPPAPAASEKDPSGTEAPEPKKKEEAPREEAATATGATESSSGSGTQEPTKA